jgi:uncharacterized protein YebE (UPF0316 family)
MQQQTEINIHKHNLKVEQKAFILRDESNELHREFFSK